MHPSRAELPVTGVVTVFIPGTEAIAQPVDFGIAAPAVLEVDVTGGSVPKERLTYRCTGREQVATGSVVPKGGGLSATASLFSHGADASSSGDIDPR